MTALQPVHRLPGLRLVLRRSWWLAVGAVLGLAAGLVVGLRQAPVYESTAYVSVSASTPAFPLSLARAAQGLARMATAPGVVGEPLREAGLPAAAAEPRRFVQVQAAPDAPLISVTGSAADPQTAQRIARTVSAALTHVSPFEPFEAAVAAAASLPDAPTTPVWVAPIGGVTLGTGLALVLAATAPPRRRRTEV